MPRSKTKAELQSELDEVKKKAAQLEKVIESLDVSLCRWLPDTTLTHANQKYKGIFGIKGQAEGKQWLDFLPEESRASTADFYDEVTKNPHVVTYEHPVTVEDGSIRHYQWFDTPLLDENGTVTEFQSIGIDITERKLSENELIAKEKKLKSLIDSQSHFMIRVNMAGRYSYWNAQFEKEFGWLHEPQGIQNSNVMISICEYHHQRVRKVVEKCVAQPGIVFSVEVDKPARDGGVRTTLWEFVCLTDDQNQPVEVQCMGIELTERKQSERLVTAQRDLARLAALGKPEEEIWAACFQAAAVVSELDCGGLYLFNKNTRAFELVYHTGLGAEFVKAVASFAEDTPTAQLVLNGHTTYLNEADLKARSYNDTERLRAAAIIPIHHRGQVLGCLNISSHVRTTVSDQARFALETIVAEIGNLLVYQQTEAELEISHIQLRQTLLAARMGAWRFDVSTTRMHWSPEAAQLLKTERQEEDAEKVLQYFYPEDREKIQQVVQEALAKRENWDFEYQITNSAGEMMWVASYGKVECDHENNPTAISGLMQDITERKQAELDLRESEKRLRAMLEVSQAMASFQEMDAVLQKIVESATTVLQLESSAIYTLEGNKLYLEATAPSLPVELPDELRYADLMDHPHINSAVSSKKAVVLYDAAAVELSSAEKIIVEARGLRSILYIPLVISEVVIGVLIAASVQELRVFSREEVALLSGFSGQVAQTMQNIRLYRAQREYTLELEKQINERKQAEENLRQSERKYRDLINGMNDTVWVIDADTRFLDVNEAAVNLLGYSREELLSMSVSDIDPSLKPETIQQLLDRMLLEKRQVLETRQRKKDGSEIPVEISSSLVLYQGRKVVMSIARDITERKKAEQEIVFAEQRYRALIENATDGIVLIGADNKFKYASPSVQRIFGYDRNETLAGDPNELTHPDDAPTVLREMEKLRHDPSYVPTLQYRFRHKNGEWRWIESTFSNLLSLPSVQAIIINFREIEERKQAEEALNKTQALLKEAQRIGRIGYMEWSGRDQTLLCSDEMYDIFEVPRGTPVSQDLIGEKMLPGERERLQQLDMLAMQQRDDLDYEYSVRAANGEIRQLRQVGKMSYDENGAPTRMMAVIQDITDRKKTEDILRQNEERLRTVADFTYDMEFWVDENRTLQYMSPSCKRITGYDRDQFLHDPSLMQFIIHPEDRQIFEEHSAGEFSLSDSSSLEFRIITAEGEVRWISHTCQPVTGEDGKFRGRRVSHRDVTERWRVLEELRASEEKYRGLVKSLTNAISVIDLNGNFLYMNDTAAADFGSTPQDIIGRNMRDLFPEPFASSQMDYVRKVFEVDQEIVYEAKSMVKKGLRWFRVSFQPLHDDIGMVNQILINATDIHDLKVAQQELQELNHTLEEKVAERTAEVKDLYENAPTGYHSINAEGKIVMVNQTELNWLGYAREEMIDHPVLEFISENTRAVFYENITLLAKRGWVKDVEFEFIRKDGSLLPVLLSATAQYDAAGNFLMSRSTIFDNTERKQAELAIRESEATYRALFENSNDGIFLMGATGEELRANQHALDMLGYTLEEYLSLGRVNQNPFTKEAEQRKDADDKLEALLRGENVPLYERVFTAKDGRKVPVEINLSPVRDANGRIILIQSVVRDIAERKAVEETLRLSRDQLRTANTALQKASQAKNEFLANMSHELRTPLNGILGMAEILLEEIRGPLNERQRKMVEVIDTSGQHLLSLINDILDLSKIEAGKLEINVEEIYVADICQTSLSFIKEPAMKKDIRVALELNPQVVTIRADMRRIKQILINLLSNAVKFTLPKGSITLRVENDAERELVHFSVLDTGIGISDEDMKKLFTPFTQVDSSLTREYEGTGLGLALVMELAELHGGSVKVESTVGQGSTFTVTIPWNRKPGHESIAIGDSMMQRSNNQIPQENSNTPKFTILLAEDMETNIMVMGDYLEDKGYNVIKAANGREAIERANSTPPNLILMDIQMPVMDGLEAIRRLRTDPRFTSVPIVALTALAMTGDRERCLEAGATEYISKPVKLKQLAELIQNLLETK